MSKKKVIYFSADTHPTYEPPKCRLETEEEWMEVQTDAVKQVAKIVGKDLLVIAGDLVDSYKQKNAQLIVNMLNDNLPENTIITMGNHSTLGCGQDKERALSEGTFGTLTRMKNINYITEPYEYGDYVLYPHDFKHGEAITHNEVNPDKKNICIGHFLSFPNKRPHWASTETSWEAKELLKEYTEYDLICVGDNHSPFNIDNKYLSPGSLTRRTINQFDYKPAIWRYDGETLEPIYLKIKPAEECISKEHKIKADEKSERIDNIVEGIKHHEQVTGDFEVDLQQHFLREKTQRPIQDMLNKIIVEIKEEK